MISVTLFQANSAPVGRSSVHVLGRALSLARLSRTLLYLLGISGSVLMLTALYMVLPVQRVTFRRALLGAVAATSLWEIVRRAGTSRRCPW